MENNWVIDFLKMTRLLLLRTVFLIWTASEKTFLIGTVCINCIENNVFLVTEYFFYLNSKISLSFCYQKCLLTDVALSSSGSSKTEFLFLLRVISIRNYEITIKYYVDYIMITRAECRIDWDYETSVLYLHSFL